MVKMTMIMDDNDDSDDNDDNDDNHDDDEDARPLQQPPLEEEKPRCSATAVHPITEIGWT